MHVKSSNCCELAAVSFNFLLKVVFSVFFPLNAPQYISSEHSLLTRKEIWSSAVQFVLVLFTFSVQIPTE